MTERRSTTIVTYSPDTSEKIIMKLDTTDEIVAHVRNWSIERMDKVNHEYAQALYEEFEGWIDLDNVEDVEIMSIEENE